MNDISENSLGSLKAKTPYYGFNIPYFDIATWHDYIEENFRSIDALFNYIYSIANYKGAWTVNTLYEVGDKVFINDANSEHVGRIFEVIEQHTTTDTTFDLYYSEHSSYYKIYLDANDSYKYAQESKNYSESAQTSAQNAEISNQQAGLHEQNALSYANNAKQSEQNAQSSATSAENYKNECKNEADFVKNYPLIKNNLEIVKELWVETEYNDIKSQYPYQALVTSFDCTYIDYKYNNPFSCFVIFNAEQIASGNYAPYCYCVIVDADIIQTVNVLIFAKEIPNSDRIFVPNVTLYYKEYINE